MALHRLVNLGHSETNKIAYISQEEMEAKNDEDIYVDTEMSIFHTHSLWTVTEN